MIYKAKDLFELLYEKNLVGIVDGELIFEDKEESYWPDQQEVI